MNDRNKGEQYESKKPVILQYNTIQIEFVKRHNRSAEALKYHVLISLLLYVTVGAYIRSYVQDWKL